MWMDPTLAPLEQQRKDSDTTTLPWTFAAVSPALVSFLSRSTWSSTSTKFDYVIIVIVLIITAFKSLNLFSSLHHLVF